MSVEEIEAFARLYGRHQALLPPSGLRLHPLAQWRRQHACGVLPAGGHGAWQHQGGGALYNQGDLYHWDKTLIEGWDLIDESTRILDQSRIGPVLVGDRQDLGDGPEVTALLIQNTNPMAVAPELQKVHRGLSRGMICSSASTSSS